MHFPDYAAKCIKVVEVARFISTWQDVFRHRRALWKGESAEGERYLKLIPWAYGEESYDCHRLAMEGYLRDHYHCVLWGLPFRQSLLLFQLLKEENYGYF